MRSSTLLLVAISALVLVSFVCAHPHPEEQQAKIAKYNARVGLKYLEERSKEADVITLPSGVRYKYIERGTGDVHPKSTDQVKVHYAGRLINGKEFDSSIARGQPATFGVNGVIKGWTELLQLMVEGDKVEVYIPGDAAYGSRGSGKDIGPNATLIFKVELIEIMGNKNAKKKPATKKAPKEEKAEL